MWSTVCFMLLVWFIPLGIIFLSHYCIYSTLVKAFDFSYISRRIFFLIIVFLSASYPLALSYSMGRETGQLLTIFFLASILWLGFAINLFIAALISRVLGIVFRQVSFRNVVIVCFAGAFLWSVFDAYQLFYSKTIEGKRAFMAGLMLLGI